MKCPHCGKEIKNCIDTNFFEGMEQEPLIDWEELLKDVEPFDIDSFFNETKEEFPCQDCPKKKKRKKGA
jgi:hypothetical protein